MIKGEVDDLLLQCVDLLHIMMGVDMLAFVLTILEVSWQMVLLDSHLGGPHPRGDWMNTPIFKILSAKICSIKEGNSPDSLNPNKIKRGKFFFRRQFGKILRSSCM
jgi:hypothetical protein